jgi:hypothetical protein
MLPPPGLAKNNRTSAAAHDLHFEKAGQFRLICTVANSARVLQVPLHYDVQVRERAVTPMNTTGWKNVRNGEPVVHIMSASAVEYYIEIAASLTVPSRTAAWVSVVQGLGSGLKPFN